MLCKHCNHKKAIDRGLCTGCRNSFYADRRVKSKNSSEDGYLLVKIANMKTADAKKSREVARHPTLEEIKMLIQDCNSTCCYSGVKLSWKSTSPIYNRGSFDRIDNTRGHSLDNIQCSSVFMNTFRGGKTDDEFRSLIRDRGLEDIPDYIIS